MIELESRGKINPDSMVRNSPDAKTGTPPPPAAYGKTIVDRSTEQIQITERLFDITILLFCTYRI